MYANLTSGRVAGDNWLPMPMEMMLADDKCVAHACISADGAFDKDEWSVR